MELTTIFTKTAKGVTQVNQKTQSLSRDLMKILKQVDGKSNVNALSKKTDIQVPVLEKALGTLLKEGYIKIFEARPESVSTFGAEPGQQDDFDFTAPNRMAQVSAQASSSVEMATGSSSEMDDEAILAAAREKSQAEARARAEREAQLRAKLEVEARARREAEVRAMEEAKRAEAAEGKARAELEAKLAEEKAKRAALSDTRNRLTKEQIQHEEEESKSLAAARANVEAEAQAMAAARTAAEAEAKVFAAARAEAEAAAQRQADQVVAAQKALRARLKEEIEAQIRAEIQEKLRVDIEEEARGEVEAAVVAEAKENARRLFEQRLADEQKKLLKIEEDAMLRAEDEVQRLLAEKESRMHSEMKARLQAIAEEKARIEMEARRMAEAQAEFAARLKAEEAARRASEMEAQARKETDARSRARLEARAREEAEERARLQAELDARRAEDQEGGAQLEAERRAREEAEKRAQLQGKAREIASRAVVEQVAEKQRIVREAKKRLLQERQAREAIESKYRADEEAEERQRQAQIAHLKELNERAEKARIEKEQANAAASKKRKIKTERHWGRWVTMTVAVILAVTVGLSYVMPLDSVNKRLEKALAGWLHDKVSIAGLRVNFFPTPHLKFETISVGDSARARAGNGRIYLNASSLFDDRYLIDKIELNQITIQTESLSQLAQWTETSGRPTNIAIGKIVLHGAKMEIKGTSLDTFDAELRFDNAGKFAQIDAKTVEPKWNLNASRERSSGVNATTDSAWAFDFTARNMSLPGTPLSIESATTKGTLIGQQINLASIDADLMGGKASGTLRIDWKNDTSFTADLDLKRINLADFIGTFTRNISISGRMDGNFSISGESAQMGALFEKPRIKGMLQLKDGSIGNIDLVQALRSSDGGARGGQTKFSELSAQFYAESGTVRYEKVKLTSGFMLANGMLTVAGNGGLNGSVNVEIRSNVAQERSSFAVSGTVSRPTLKRGG